VKASVPPAQRPCLPKRVSARGHDLTFADTLCGYGCIAHLPGNAEKLHPRSSSNSNFLAPRREGTVHGEAARRCTWGRTTQVWDRFVTHGEERRRLALFRCTQLA